MPCLPSLALSTTSLSSDGPNSTCFSHVGIFCALISVQLILDLVVSLAENFVIKTIYFSMFVVASVYLQLMLNFPIMPFVCLPIKLYEERKPADTITEGRGAFIAANCNFSENMLNCKCYILKG